MNSIELSPVRYVEGTVRLPGSKSLSNRVLLLAALARGVTRVTNLLDSDDVAHMLRALADLGIEISIAEGRGDCEIRGVGAPFASRAADLYLGNAGTAMRPLTAALCLGNGDYVLRGDRRMHERPIGDLVDALRQAGAEIAYLGQEGYPPLAIRAHGLSGGRITVDGGTSSQFLSALLLAAPLARGPTDISVVGDLVSKPYVDMTRGVMERFGVRVPVEREATYHVEAPSSYTSPGAIAVEGDASSASYFLAAAAIRGGTVRVEGVGEGSLQGDLQFVGVLERMGATARWGAHFVEVQGGAPLHGLTVDAREFPDAAMTLATTALFAIGPTRILGIANWRVKETDRIAAVACELRKLGAQVVESRDGLEITPPSALRGAEIETYDDHRMAMAFSLAALGDVAIVIRSPECTSKTFPDYFDLFKAVTHSRPASR